MVKDAGLPPNIEPFAKNAAGRAIYTLGDLFTGFDHASVAEESRDLFTFQTPLGPHRLTCLPMGWTNSVAIFQGHVAFILQDEIEVAPPYLDDIPVLGTRTRYEQPDGSYKTIPDNYGIHRFAWEHLSDVNWVFHRMKHAGGTFSGHKLFLCVPEVKIVGHICNYQGRIPDRTCISKIENWPPCENVLEVHGFLGTCGVVRIFIHNFAEIARPLVELTKKDMEFMWDGRRQQAMDDLKQQVLSAPALCPIDYQTGRQVIITVDSSQTAVGWILSQ
jgi:Reverse transcriptase (RNA-dependent DNA polymerase)